MVHLICILIRILTGVPELLHTGPAIGECTPVGEKNEHWPPELRKETRQRLWSACKAVGGSDFYCTFWDAVGLRESSYSPGVRHTLGHNENGLGVIGLSLRWHRDKWPGRDEDPAWCQPEASFTVGHAIAWRALDKYKADDFIDVQAIFAGKWTCWGEGPDRMCRADPSAATERSICGRMRHFGYSCHRMLRRSDLGQKIPRHRRRTWARQQAAAWSATNG